MRVWGVGVLCGCGAWVWGVGVVCWCVCGLVCPGQGRHRHQGPPRVSQAEVGLREAPLTHHFGLQDLIADWNRMRPGAGTGWPLPGGLGLRVALFLIVTARLSDGYPDWKGRMAGLLLLRARGGRVDVGVGGWRGQGQASGMSCCRACWGCDLLPVTGLCSPALRRKSTFFEPKAADEEALCRRCVSYVALTPSDTRHTYSRHPADTCRDFC